MNPRRALWSLLMLVGFVSWTQAQAAGGYFDGTLQPVGAVCPITNNIVVASQNSVGYYTDPNSSYPATGDTEYIHATSTNVSPCSNDAVGFRFQLPDGASYAISAVNPVICIRRRISDGHVETFTNDANGSCSQTPQAGAGGGTYFGYSAIAPGWQLEMRIPVVWNQQLLGLAGPNTHKLLAAADTAWGTVIAEQAVTIFYRASFANPSVTNQSSTGAHVQMDLYSFFKGGTAYADYGTTTNYGSSVTIGSIADAQIGYGVFADLAGLNAGTTYNWRIRFVTASGTFTSANQTFSTGAAQNFALSLTKNGTGSGTVSSTPTGINCGATCSANFTSGASVSLNATPASGSAFAGWGGACSGTGACSVTMSAAQSVTATFNAAPPPQVGSLSLEVTGLPSGSSATLGIAGPNGFSSSRTITTGTGQNLSDVEVGAYTVTAPNVTVGTTTYAPNNASQTANVTFGGNATVSVVYAASTTPTFALSLTKAGTGTGAVSSSPAGINCGTTCTANFNQNASVTLTAAPAAGSSFVSWGGACSGATCTVTMNAAKSVTATFNTVPTGGTNFALTVTKSGTGTGGITSNPGGINCGATCSANFAQGNTVSLTATPDAASSFTGWSGACSGTGACNVTMDAAKSVTATFTASGVTPPQPPAGATAAASKASNTPATANGNKGANNVPALGVNLGVGSSAGTLQSVTLSASGTGNDQLDITSAKLYLDANSNGVVDAGETALAQGTFSANDGTATLTLTTPKALAASSNSRLLVTLNFNSSIAGMPLKAALGSAALALLLSWRSKRRFAVIALAGLAVTLNACGNTVTPVGVIRTYQVTMTAVNLKDSSNASIPMTGLPISGTTISVTK
jgi:Divergent InlB B-repeat domain